ncbi:MAG: DotD/TraH family lipoprotein [Boseongicola sp. SB0677_bin_26]|nr:DotD/TraH family lipoprotein [Boseongicola sp. SB0665_bin_10]MYG26692.1 DotD/TraH family lipoprotein [Boseongicola sp. SB0677_bin_26]
MRKAAQKVLLSAVALALVAPTLAGCSDWDGDAWPRSTYAEEQGSHAAIDIEERLATSMEKAAAANAAVAEIEAAVVTSRNPGLQAQGDLPATVVLPPEMMLPVSIDWKGPVEKLLAELGRRAGYQFEVAGVPPANGILVTLAARNEPIYGVLRRAGHVVHGDADILLDLEAMMITLRYDK